MPPRRNGKETEDEFFQKGNEEILIQDDEAASTSEEEENDDDPVVKTYDVFLSNQLNGYIYLLQFPIRNPDEEYVDETAPLFTRMKPKEGTMEIDVPIDSNYFSMLRGEKFAVSHGEANMKSVLDRQRLTGKPQPNQANYFVAVMRGSLSQLRNNADVVDEMHLSPIKAAVQLRPNFHYYDTSIGDKRKKPQTEDVPASRQPRAVQVENFDLIS